MKLCFLLFAAALAFGQTTRYPGALDTDNSLFVVADNVQTTLTSAMGTGDTAAVVSSGAGFVPNMVVTICDTSTNTGKCTAWEHMLVTAVSGNVLTVNRAFAGTTARSHSSGRLISALIDAMHQKVLKDAVIAMQTALGPNLSNIASGSLTVNAASYSFSAYSCNSGNVCASAGTSGMNLIAGNNTLTMTPVPPGVNGTDTGHALYVSGGAGTAEACTITGGSGQSGQASGQIILSCSNTHSGAWTIQSATGGIQEAVCGLPTAGGEVQANTAITLLANVSACGKTTPVVTRLAGGVFTGSFLVLGSRPSAASVQSERLYKVPTWATLTNIYDASRHVIGDYPLNEEINQGLFGETQAVVGAIAVPAGSTTQNNFGVAGYSKTAATTGAAVGVFGQGVGVANGVGAWGANFACNNFAGSSGPGFVTNCWGIEVDLNGSGTGSPPANMWGVATVSALYQSPAGEFNAYKAHRGTVTQAPFKQSYMSSDGAGVVAFYAGATHESNSNADSQLTKWKMRDSGGAVHEAALFLNSSNYLTTLAGAYAWETETGVPYLTMDGSSIRIGTAAGAYFTLGSKTFGTLGTPAAGTIVYCTDCNATCAAGSGAGKFCKREAGAWAAF